MLWFFHFLQMICEKWDFRVNIIRSQWHSIILQLHNINFKVYTKWNYFLLHIYNWDCHFFLFIINSNNNHRMDTRRKLRDSQFRADVYLFPLSCYFLSVYKKKSIIERKGPISFNLLWNSIENWKLKTADRETENFYPPKQPLFFSTNSEQLKLKFNE